VRDPLSYFSTIASVYGDVVCYRPAPDTAYLINHPDYVRHVLVDNNRNYSKETHTNQQFNKVVAEGLLTTEGDVWRKQRRMMQPAFHRPGSNYGYHDRRRHRHMPRWQELQVRQPVTSQANGSLTRGERRLCLVSWG
jgi:cytochrome P450